LGAGLDYWGSATPNSSFAFPTGQAISRTTYASLFSLIGTTYGTGDGSTTFNLPDKSGRVSAMKEASATRLTPTYFGGNSTNMGAIGGTESHLLTSAEIPAHSHPNTLTDPGHLHGAFANSNDAANAGLVGESGGIGYGSAGSTASAASGISINNANNTGGGNAHAIVQPTIICNYIIRII
jgi:microcystin-dependent protein